MLMAAAAADLLERADMGADIAPTQLALLQHL